MEASWFEWLFLGGPWKLMLGVPVAIFALCAVVTGFRWLFGLND